MFFDRLLFSSFFSFLFVGNISLNLLKTFLKMVAFF